jgi:tetratricopeptide (TPR) repeat protein
LPVAGQVGSRAIGVMMGLDASLHPFLAHPAYKDIAALDKALAIDPDYFEALSYINLLYREKSQALSAVGKNQEAGEAYAKADEYQKKAIEIRKAQMANKPKAS